MERKSLKVLQLNLWDQQGEPIIRVMWSVREERKEENCELGRCRSASSGQETQDRAGCLLGEL